MELTVLSSALCSPDRPGNPEPVPKPHTEGRKIMKKFGFASVIATGFVAAIVGLAAPAQADITHHEWVHDIQQHATTGQVTSVFGNGR